MCSYFADPCSSTGEIELHPQRHSVYLTSPDYPDRYPYNLDCTWYFSSSNSTAGSFIVRVLDLYTPSRDIVTMGTGDNSTREEVFLMSRKYFPNSVSFEGDVMWIRFVSDGRSSYRGFLLTVERRESPGTYQKFFPRRKNNCSVHEPNNYIQF